MQTYVVVLTKKGAYDTFDIRLILVEASDAAKARVWAYEYYEDDPYIKIGAVFLLADVNRIGPVVHPHWEVKGKGVK